MANTWRWFGTAVLAAALCAGCGASRSLQQAQESFDGARQAGAETKAPYEFFSAETYLQLAQHELDEMDLKQAASYAEKSLDFSKQALGKAGGGAQ